VELYFDLDGGGIPNIDTPYSRDHVRAAFEVLLAEYDIGPEQPWEASIGRHLEV
jgi:hypothetical protein